MLGVLTPHIRDLAAQKHLEVVNSSIKELRTKVGRWAEKAI